MGVREERRRALLQGLSDAAWESFDQLAETSVEELARRAGVSKRTFFRIYESKEAALYGDWRESLTQLREFVQSRSPDERVATTLLELSRGWALMTEADRPRALARRRRSQHHRGMGQYEEGVIWPTFRKTVSEELMQRGTGPEDAALVASVLASVLASAKTRWLDQEGVSLLRAVNEAWACVSIAL